MNAQDLKNSILQLAIQGKLVEQREEEGTAEELYQQIQEEKEKLIKEGKIKKEKPLPEITEEEIPFDIPESWEWVRLGDIAFLNSGGQYEESDTGFFYIKVADMNIEENRIEILTSSRKANCPLSSIIPKGSIIFPKRGGAILTNKKRLVLQTEICIDSNTMGMTVVNFSCLEYIYNWFMGIDLGKLVTGTSVPQINNKDIYPLLVPLPPLEEQKRIVAKIEELMPYVEQYCEAHSKLEVFKKKFPEDMQKSILQYALQGKLVKQKEEEGTAEEIYQQIQEEKVKLIKEGNIKKERPLQTITEDEIPFDIPESWKWVRVGDIFQINPRNKLKDDVSVSFIPMTLLEAGYQNMFSYEVRQWGEVKNGFTHLKDRDIVMAKITPCFQNLKSAIMKDLENGFGAGTTELHVFRPFKNICLEYFMWFIKSPVFISNCVANMTGTAGQQRIGKNFIANYLVPLPPFEEQKRIVVKIEELLICCKNLAR